MSSPSPSQTDAPYTSRLAPGVHAYVQPDGGWCLNNAGFISDGRTTLLVDTAATERRALLLRDALTAAGVPQPDHVVNTHHHGDHTYGNSVFTPGARIVGHTACVKEQLAAGLQLHAIWPDVDYGEVPVTPATVTYEDELTLHVGEEEVRLLHPGVAHTLGDTVVWLPGPRVVFTGDLVFNGGAPFVPMGSLAGSLRGLELLRSLDAEVVVPGHGQVCDPSVYDTTEGYLRFVTELAADGHKAGREPLEVARAADPGEFASLREPERLVANLHRAYAELDGLPPGSPLDLVRIITDMAVLNGGRVPECLA
ncbi:MBL fold metallo-hydrolase [Streptomyces sp. NPDC046977]|uniref:MBL fold metallo-hydrolase n=1 Tax=Streptomyces sp. NPDC046977 TaxID=3154703 RepID=UPI0033D89EFA